MADAFFLLAIRYRDRAAALSLAYRLSDRGLAHRHPRVAAAGRSSPYPSSCPSCALLPALERLVSGAYAVLDLVALVPLLLLLRLTWAFRGGRVWQVWASLLFGFLLTFAGDVLVASQLIAAAQESGADADTLDFLSSVMFTLSYLAIASGTLQSGAGC